MRLFWKIYASAFLLLLAVVVPSAYLEAREQIVNPHATFVDILLINAEEALVVTLTLGLVLYGVIRHIMGPVWSLVAGAAAVGAGDLAHRVSVGSRDELGDLARSFNTMAESLQRTTVSRDYVDSILGNMSDTLIVLNAAGIIVRVNQATCDLLGGVEDELCGRSFIEVCALDGSADGRAFQRLAEGGGLRNYETTYRSRSGCRIPVLLSCSVIRNASAGVLNFVCSGRDISDRRQAEIALREKESRYRLLFEGANDGILIAKGDHIVDCNLRALEMFGATRDAFLGLGAAQISPPEQPDGRESEALAKEHIQKAMRGEPQCFEWRLRRLDGKLFDAEISLNRCDLGGETHIQVLVRDVSRRKRAEEALRRAGEQLRLIAEHVSDMVWTMTLDGRFTFMTASVKRTFGFTVEEAIARPLDKFLTPESYRKAMALLAERLASPKNEPVSMELEHYCKDGATKWGEVTAVITRTKDGKPTGILGVTRDSTERKAAERALAELQRRQQALLNNIPDMAWLKDRDSRFIAVNEPFAKAAGRPPEDMVGKSDLDIWRADIAAAYRADDAEVVSTARPKRVEEPIVGADGSTRWIDTIKTPIIDDAGQVTGTAGIARDVTERKATEKQREKTLHQQQAISLLRQSLLEHGTLDAKLATITEGIVRIFDADFCRIWYIRPGDRCESGCVHAQMQEGPHVCLHRDRCLHLLASSGRYTHTDGAVHRRVPLGCYKIGRIASSDQHKLLSEDVVNDPQTHNPQWARDLGLVSFAGYQLRAPNGETLGVLALFSKHAISVEEDAILDGLSSSAGLVMQQTAAEEALEAANHRLEQANSQLATLATTDELTGLANRRRLAEILRIELERVRRHGASLGLAMIDVDHFKAVNDAFGHAFGDRALAHIAGLLKAEARITDTVARYGGEEFIVLMPDTGADEAFQAAERIRQRIAAESITEADQPVAITASFGISAATKTGVTTADVLVRQADEALYMAKQAGRNCTRSWTDIGLEPSSAIADAGEQAEALRHRVTSLSLQARDAFVETMLGLVHALESRDWYSSSHSANVAAYAVGVAETLGLPPRKVEVVRCAAVVHDTGKIGIPASILRKDGVLTAEERQVIQQHPLIGVRILDEMQVLEHEIPIVRHHHEHWDGQGYPDGLSGRAIPLGARILAVADAFDAITSDRPYRAARTVMEALAIMQQESGRQFDPAMVDALTAWIAGVGRQIGKGADITTPDLLAAPQAVQPAGV